MWKHYLFLGCIPEIDNVFTPNSDGINDVFSFDEFGMNTVSVEIYNRWGQVVYLWDGTDKNWSGVDISGEDVATSSPEISTPLQFLSVPSHK